MCLPTLELIDFMQIRLSNIEAMVSKSERNTISRNEATIG